MDIDSSILVLRDEEGDKSFACKLVLHIDVYVSLRTEGHDVERNVIPVILME